MSIVKRHSAFRTDFRIERIQTTKTERMHAVDDTGSLTVVAIVVFQTDAAWICTFFFTSLICVIFKFSSIFLEMHLFEDINRQNVWNFLTHSRNSPTFWTPNEAFIILRMNPLYWYLFFIFIYFRNFHSFKFEYSTLILLVDDPLWITPVFAKNSLSKYFSRKVSASQNLPFRRYSFFIDSFLISRIISKALFT